MGTPITKRESTMLKIELRVLRAIVWENKKEYVCMNKELKSMNGKLDSIASDVKGALYAIRELTERLSSAPTQVEIPFDPLPVSVSNTSVPGVNPVWSSRDQCGRQTGAPGSKDLPLQKEANAVVSLPTVIASQVEPGEPKFCPPSAVTDMDRWQTKDKGLSFVQAEGMNPSKSTVSLKGKTPRSFGATWPS